MNARYFLTRYKSAMVAFVVAIIGAPGYLWAEMDAAMMITGGTLEPIVGTEIFPGLSGGRIKVIGYNDSISIGFDQATGLPTGKRQHRPIRIVKEVDQTTLQIGKAFYDGATFTSVILWFFRVDSGGATIPEYRVVLGNAQIVSIISNHDSTDTSKLGYETETISFTYQTITKQSELDFGLVSSTPWQ